MLKSKVMKPPAVIFDIDGTLSDCSHRRHLIEGEKKDWKAFYSALGEDKPNLLLKEMIDYLLDKTQSRVLFVTGRPAQYAEETNNWILKHMPDCFEFALIYMRPNGNNEPDDELKKKIYLEKIEPKYDVKLVLEDRSRVVKMWRSLGLTCWQVAEGDF